jgi:dihydroceramide fatty acyl 2-hydroxylase
MKMEYSRHASARLFENEFLEICSKVHPITPLVVYGPLVVGLLAYGLSHALTTPLQVVIFFLAGYLTWCVLEYAIHRYFFHWEGNGPLTRKLHAIIHGYHHEYPDDPLRLVMPLGASIPLAIFIGGLLYSLNRPAAALPMFCGIVVGYLVYDYMHWAVHARKPITEWGRAMRSHHMSHHFADTESNFGISHRWIDWVVGSLRKR